MSENVLHVKGLKFGFTPDNLLFDGFDLSINQGEIVSVVGESGSGKSTLLELISSNLKPIEGTLTCKALAQVYQDPYTSFHPTYTIMNQLKDTCKDLKELDKFCNSLELDKTLIYKRPKELSGGQLQRCSILRALLMKPKLLLCDEPTSALDNLTQLEVMKLLIGLLDNVGILLITHDDALASWCSDKIVRI